MSNNGYNTSSLKPKQCPASVSRLFCAPNLGKRVSIYTGILATLGVLGNGNVPAVLGSESAPAFIGGFSISKPKEPTWLKIILA